MPLLQDYTDFHNEVGSWDYGKPEDDPFIWILGEEGEHCDKTCAKEYLQCTDGNWGVWDRETFDKAFTEALTHYNSPYLYEYTNYLNKIKKFKSTDSITDLREELLRLTNGDSLADTEETHRELTRDMTDQEIKEKYISMLTHEVEEQAKKATLENIKGEKCRFYNPPFGSTMSTNMWGNKDGNHTDVAPYWQDEKYGSNNLITPKSCHFNYNGIMVYDGVPQDSNFWRKEGNNVYSTQVKKEILTLSPISGEGGGLDQWEKSLERGWITEDILKEAGITKGMVDSSNEVEVPIYDLKVHNLETGSGDIQYIQGKNSLYELWERSSRNDNMDKIKASMLRDGEGISKCRSDDGFRRKDLQGTMTDNSVGRAWIRNEPVPIHKDGGRDNSDLSNSWWKDNIEEEKCDCIPSCYNNGPLQENTYFCSENGAENLSTIPIASTSGCKAAYPTNSPFPPDVYNWEEIKNRYSSRSRAFDDEWINLVAPEKSENNIEEESYDVHDHKKMQIPHISGNWGEWTYQGTQDDRQSISQVHSMDKSIRGRLGIEGNRNLEGNNTIPGGIYGQLLARRGARLLPWCGGLPAKDGMRGTKEWKEEKESHNQWRESSYIPRSFTWSKDSPINKLENLYLMKRPKPGTTPFERGYHSFKEYKWDTPPELCSPLPQNPICEGHLGELTQAIAAGPKGECPRWNRYENLTLEGTDRQIDTFEQETSTALITSLNNALHAAVSEEDASKVEKLINLGAHVNIADSHGRTPLANSRNDQISSILHEAGGTFVATPQPLTQRSDLERITEGGREIPGLLQDIQRFITSRQNEHLVGQQTRNNSPCKNLHMERGIKRLCRCHYPYSSLELPRNTRTAAIMNKQILHENEWHKWDNGPDINHECERYKEKKEGLLSYGLSTDLETWSPSQGPEKIRFGNYKKANQINMNKIKGQRVKINNQFGIISSSQPIQFEDSYYVDVVFDGDHQLVSHNINDIDFFIPKDITPINKDGLPFNLFNCQ